MAGQTRGTLLYREAAHDLWRATVHDPAVEPMTRANWEAWVAIDDTVAGALTDLRVLVSQAEMHRRATARDTEQKRTRRTMATAAD